MIEILLEAERALSVGLLDQAERLYRQASDADPRNSIAVVGLARVALERGDEHGALAEAERALEIDAENEAARRMVDRLREVRRHRAASPPERFPDLPERTAEPPATAVEPVTAAGSTATPEPERPVLAPTTIHRPPGVVETAPAPVADPKPVAESPEPVEAALTAVEREPVPEPERAAPRGGGILGWLRRLFRRR